MPKRCKERLYNHIRVALWKKPIPKTPNIRKIIAFSKCSKLAKMHGLQPMRNGYGQFGSKIKNAKKVRKTIVRPRYSCCVQKPLQKHLIFEKREHYLNDQNWPRCMGYSPCKIVSLGQKLKMPKTCEKGIEDHIRVVVCKILQNLELSCAKNRLKETLNIGEMRQPLKWPIMQRLQPQQNPHFGSKIKIPKRMSKVIQSCSDKGALFFSFLFPSLI